jgi:hypothetical protein
MKKTSLFAAITIAILLEVSCRNASQKNATESDIFRPTIKEQFLPVGKDIITEVVIKPDTLGDPWEVEKVKGFDGREMFTDLLKKIYKGKLTVYDCFSEEALDKSAIKTMEKEVGYEISKIGKIQFLEDWYFDPLTSSIIKKVKSVTFAYEIIRQDGLPTGYKGLFRVKTE